MMPDDMPDSVRAIIERIAKRYEVAPDGIFKRYGQRTPDERAARDRAMLEISDLTRNGRPRFSRERMAAWFGCTRNSVYTALKRSPDFAPRTAPARVEP